MIPYRAGLFTLTALAVALTAPVCAGPPQPNHDARRLAARIDELIEKRLDEAHVKPAPPADDGVFLRRVTLDIGGKAPRVADVRRFLEAKRSDKHERAVEALLDSPAYARHFSGIWSKLLIPEANSDFQKRYLVPSMESWLRQQFSENVPYDRMVRQILTHPFGRTASVNQEIQFAYGGGGRASPVAFYQTKLGKPEDLAASTARLFMGVRLECAQCHDHPFGKWTREEFWGLAGFYGGLRPVRNPFQPIRGELIDRRELAIPGTERVAQARFLDGTRPRWKFKVGARETLADWLTAKDNPFFARAAANRMWEHFFGIGLVDPVDDFRDDNPPSHPELLDLLAKEFAAHDYDLKFLIRAITYSKTYQRASTTGDRNTSEDRLFARMAVRALTAEQLYDSIVEASGLRGRERQPSMRIAINGPQRQFLDKFDVQQERTNPQTSIPQALAMMNSELVREATNPNRGPTVAAVAAAPFLTTEEKVETLYLAALGRKPRPEESKKFVAYVEKGGATGNAKKALGDVFWALLNSTEFYFNH